MSTYVAASSIVLCTLTVDSSPRREQQGPFSCPLCPRRHLANAKAFWTHLQMRHSPHELNGAPSSNADSDVSVLSDRTESTLIRICNATTLDEAVDIATSALVGE